MNAKSAASETSASNKELAHRIAELELRIAEHDEILSFLKTILEQLRESGYRLALTDAQHAELNRWLNKCETNLKTRLRSSEIH